jgi:hypothetical protein
MATATPATATTKTDDPLAARKDEIKKILGSSNTTYCKNYRYRDHDLFKNSCGPFSAHCLFWFMPLILGPLLSIVLFTYNPCTQTGALFWSTLGTFVGLSVLCAIRSAIHVSYARFCTMSQVDTHIFLQWVLFLLLGGALNMYSLYTWYGHAFFHVFLLFLGEAYPSMPG